MNVATSEVVSLFTWWLKSIKKLSFCSMLIKFKLENFFSFLWWRNWWKFAIWNKKRREKRDGSILIKFQSFKCSAYFQSLVKEQKLYWGWIRWMYKIVEGRKRMNRLRNTKKALWKERCICMCVMLYNIKLNLFSEEMKILFMRDRKL